MTKPSTAQLTHDPHCNMISVVDLDRLVRLMSELLRDVECYCSDNPQRICPVHEAEDWLRENDRAGQKR